MQAVNRTFAMVLADCGRGRLHEQLTDKLREVTEAVMATGKKGKLTLTIDVARYPNDTGGVVSIKAAVKTVVPGAEDPASIFFVTESGDLTKDSPQRDLGLREVGERPQAREHAQ